MKTKQWVGILLVAVALQTRGENSDAWKKIAPHFAPPAEYAGKLGPHRSPLVFDDGTPVRNAEDWARRRKEILEYWHSAMGRWPELLEKPKVEFVEMTAREGFTQWKVKVEVARGQMADGYLLVPQGPELSSVPRDKYPAVFVPYYEPESSIGTNPKAPLRDFAYQLTKRGFVTLSVGSPGGDARKPPVGADGKVVQPLSFLAYVAANCHTAPAQMPEVDAKRIGVVGHSYGGKWAMFASCLHAKYAAAAWSDGGIVWDEKRSNVNFWEPWYLGYDPNLPEQRKPGVLTPERPRTGAYKTMVENNRDLHELHALMAPRPFLVSGGSEDQPERWPVLNHAIAVNKLLGAEDRVAMTNRPAHSPTEESNEAIYLFFEHFLKKK